MTTPRFFVLAVPALIVAAGCSVVAGVDFGSARERIDPSAAAEAGLDDVAVEACKAAAMRSQKELQFSSEADLRLVGVKGDKLLLAWINPADSTVGEMLAVPKSLYDEIVADEDGDWSAFKSDYEGVLFVDLNRMLVTQAD